MDFCSEVCTKVKMGQQLLLQNLAGMDWCYDSDSTDLFCCGSLYGVKSFHPLMHNIF